MADEAIIDIRLGNIERDCQEIKGEFREFEERLDNHTERLTDLEHWYTGNEAKGAEARLQSLEGYCGEMNKANLRPRVNTIEAEVVALQKIADSAIMESVQGAVNVTLDRREKTAVAKLKAWGPIVAAISAVIVAIVTAVFR